MTLVTVPTSLDTDDLTTILALVGFPADKIDTAQAVAQAESQGYVDAVGDITLVSAKYGPSIGLFQVRSLRHPPSYGGLDLWRHAWPLRNAWFNASAALALSKAGTDWSAWSTFTSNAYQAFLGQRPVVKTGHKSAADWWR